MQGSAVPPPGRASLLHAQRDKTTTDGNSPRGGRLQKLTRPLDEPRRNQMGAQLEASLGMGPAGARDPTRDPHLLDQPPFVPELPPWRGGTCQSWPRLTGTYDRA